MRYYLAIGALCALAGCAGTDTMKATYTLGGAYQAATLVEAGCISTGTCDAAQAKALDNTAYAAIQPLVSAAATGGTPTAVQLAAAQKALTAFQTYVGAPK